MSERRESYGAWITRMRQSFEGVSDPHAMGTTGLIGWVLVGGEDRYTYNRLRTAIKIIEKRRGNVRGFGEAIFNEEVNLVNRARLNRYFKTLLPRETPVS